MAPPSSSNDMHRPCQARGRSWRSGGPDGAPRLAAAPWAGQLVLPVATGRWLYRLDPHEADPLPPVLFTTPMIAHALGVSCLGAFSMSSCFWLLAFVYSWTFDYVRTYVVEPYPDGSRGFV